MITIAKRSIVAIARGGLTLALMDDMPGAEEMLTPADETNPCQKVHAWLVLPQDVR